MVGRWVQQWTLTLQNLVADCIVHYMWKHSLPQAVILRRKCVICSFQKAGVSGDKHQPNRIIVWRFRKLNTVLHMVLISYYLKSTVVLNVTPLKVDQMVPIYPHDNLLYAHYGTSVKHFSTKMYSSYTSLFLNVQGTESSTKSEIVASDQKQNRWILNGLDNEWDHFTVSDSRNKKGSPKTTSWKPPYNQRV